ncbi:MAG: histidine kinase [Rubrobacteraceae bacterium]
MGAEQAAAMPMGGRIASRAAWPLCGLTMAFISCALALAYLNRYDGPLGFLVAVASAALVGGLISSRRPRMAVGWIVVGHALCFTLGEFTRQYAIYGALTDPGSLPFATAVAWPSYWLWFPGLVLMLCFLPLYFPDGRLLSRRWRPVAWLAALVAATTATLAAFQPGDSETPGLPNPLGLEGMRPFGTLDIAVPALWLGAGCLSAASLVVRFRRSRGPERQQIKWLAYALSLMLLFFLVDSFFLQSLASDAMPFLGGIVLAAPWLAIGVAILRHNLYDIDFIINRTLLYGALTACVVGIYVFVVGYLGTLFRTEGSLAISLLATGVVAVAFQPLRDKLQRTINRLMYGERDEPYEVLSRLGERLEGALDPDSALSTIVETVAQAMNIPHAAISLDLNGESVNAAEHGTPKGTPTILPLAYGGRGVGQLVLSPRSVGEEFSSSDKRLLEDLARQAGVAARAVQLTADLRRSREEIVTAREEERRRLRRDLHDGLGPRLAAQTLKVGSAKSLFPRDPETANMLLEELERDLDGAMADVKRLVYDLRPPALDELGLAGAIRDSASQYDSERLRVAFEEPDNLINLPAAVEVAAYRISQEALANVARHANAKECLVRLSVAGNLLELEVSDDGAGLPEKRRAGVGLASMRERAEELGGTCEVGASPEGGVRVLMRLPLPDERKETE